MVLYDLCVTIAFNTYIMLISHLEKSRNLVAYKGEFESALKQIENEIKHLLRAMEKRYGERLNKIDEAQNSCETNAKEI